MATLLRYATVGIDTLYAAGQGYSVFGKGLHLKPKTSERVLSHVGPCLAGTPPMNQHPLTRSVIMIPQPRPLLEVFADLPDFRHAKGKRPPRWAILALSCCALLCGYRS